MRYKKVLILVLSMVFIVCLVAISASSVLENREEVRSTYINSIDARINVGTLNTTVKGQIQGTTNVTRITIKLELQKKSSGSYSTIKTWEETFYTDAASKTESKITSPFSTYRLKATFTVYTSTNSETRVLYAY